jgi:Na+/melibiose symporter-like transporter
MVVVTFLMGPIGVVQGIYAKYFGLPLTTIATVLLIARLFDAITDPLIGNWSDRYYARTGSRKLFVVSGCLLFVVSSYFLYVPYELSEKDMPYQVSTAYFLGWFLAFFLAWTLFEVPHLAWGGQLAVGSKEKNKIYSLRALGGYIGTLLFFSVPLLPFFDTSEMTPQTLEWSVISAAVLVVPMLYFCITAVPDKHNKRSNIYSRHSNIHNEKIDYLSAFSVVIKSKPFLLFFTAFSFAGIGIGMWVGVMFIFIDSYLELGDKFALIYILTITIATISLALWHQLTLLIGKKHTWGLSLLIMFVGILGVSFIPADESNWLHLLGVMILINCGFSAMAILPPSLLSDISDYAFWKFGSDYAATYFSLYTLVVKSSAAIGSAISLTITGWFGFDPAASHNSGDSVYGLLLAGSWLPNVFALAALVFVALTPIDARRHMIIRRRLDIRDIRHAASD